jgi:hypothetical protein
MKHETDKEALYHLKQQLDQVILRLKESSATIERSSESIHASSETLHDATTKTLSHIPVFEEMQDHLVSHIHESITESMENSINDLADETLSFLKTNLIDTVNGLNREIQDVMTTLTKVKTKEHSYRARSLIKRGLILGGISIFCGMLGAMIGVWAYMKWVLPQHELYYEYGKTWKAAYDGLSEGDRKRILDIFKHQKR